MNNHKDLEVWKNAVEFVGVIYKATSTFPKEEKYGLTSQIRRSVVSISSNIAEGAARGGNKEFIRFLFISLGSNAELETQLIIAQELGFIDQESFEELNAKTNSIARMLMGLIRYRKSLKSKSRNGE